jgi:hypothetical protein
MVVDAVVQEWLRQMLGVEVARQGFVLSWGLGT